MERLFDVPGELFDGDQYREPARVRMEAPRVTCPACGGSGCECEARGFEALRLV